MPRLLSFILSLLVSSLFLGSTCWAALPQGIPVRGKVLDSTRAPIEGVQVVPLSNSAAGGEGGTATNSSGEFNLVLPQGQWVLKFSKTGFKDSVLTFDADSNGPVTLEVVLQVAPVESVVIVNEPAPYLARTSSSATKTLTALIDTPQSLTVITRELIRDQMMMSIADVVRYVPGISSHQGENNRDQVVIRGNSSSADFFVNGVRDDVQYYRDLYNLDRVEALKGPNAMIFGRGGGGGVINRVTKEAGPGSFRELSLSGGQFGDFRAAVDANAPLGRKLAGRVNGVFERADSFRKFVEMQRYGIAPTLTIVASQHSRVVASFENLQDHRVADRGITSYRGRPADVPIATFYGNPDASRVRAAVNLGSVLFEHQRRRWTIRNRSLVGDYDRFYQNFVPGTVNADKTQVTLTAYNNSTNRLNLFNQTDVTAFVSSGPVRHTLLAGMELGRQVTNNFRQSGFFSNSASSILVPYANPLTQLPVTFRQSATDADNRLRAHVAAFYLQDQIRLTGTLQIVAGLRFDNFDLRYHDQRNGDRLRRIDNLVSPRLGLIVKLAPAVSLYGNYSVSYLPSSGDQFSSLTVITQQIKPEKFNNYEGGVKWDIRSSLSLTAALYRLDRTNTRSTDPNDPARIVQTGSQRTNGFELGLNGNLTRDWQISGGYAYQDAYISSATVSARLGARVGQVPRHSFSLWNNYQFTRRLGAGLGILQRTEMFAAVDNTVVLPGYVRADAALFYSVTEKMRFQLNVENVLGRVYFVHADSNTNISPGSPRAVRAGLVARF